LRWWDVACEASLLHERQPVRNQKLRALVAQIVLRLDHEDLEHEHRIEGRSAAMRATAPRQRLPQNRSDLEIDRLSIELELIAEIAQPLQPLLDVEKPRLTRHFYAPVPCRIQRQ